MCLICAKKLLHIRCIYGIPRAHPSRKLDAPDETCSVVWRRSLMARARQSTCTSPLRPFGVVWRYTARCSTLPGILSMIFRNIVSPFTKKQSARLTLFTRDSSRNVNHLSADHCRMASRVIIAIATLCVLSWLAAGGKLRFTLIAQCSRQQFR